MNSQVTPGSYQIKLAFNQKSLEISSSNKLNLNPTCENPLAATCKNQMWNIKSVPNLHNVFTITNAKSNMLITYVVYPVNKIIDRIMMSPEKTDDKKDEQYFLIKATRGTKDDFIGFTIQPYLLADVTAGRLKYLAAKPAMLNVNNCTLLIEDTTDSGNTTYENLIFSLQKLTPVIVSSSQNVSNVIVSPSVIVAPKSDNKLDIDFKTGGDNLEPKDFMEGLKVTVKIKNKPDLVKENVNEGREWPNNSIRRVSISLPADVVCSDIHEIVLSRIPKGGSANNISAMAADNWNLDKVTVTTRIKTNGTMKTGTMNWMSPSGSGYPLYRFVYENRDSDINTGNSLTLQTGSICPSSNANSTTTTSTPTNASLNCVFGTGGDNLEGGSGNNVNIRIKFKSSNNIITLSNVNDTAKWNNFTENTVTKSIPNSATIDINDIKEVEVRHTGGGGMFADNWHVDKIKITITKNGVSRVLVDRVGAPIHRFTGDTRIKRFTVE